MVSQGDNFALKRQWFIGSRSDNLEDSYSIDCEIGSGAYGKVYKAVSLVRECPVSIKAVQKVRVADYKTFVTEVELLKVLDHPHIMKIIETFETSLICYIVAEYYEGGELFERIIQEKKLTELSAARIMRQLFSGLTYCHSQGICHRDLKPENILFSNKSPDSDIVIIDFGLGKRFTEKEVMNSFKGTAYYVAPDVLLGNYTYIVDCWSIGVMLYTLLCGALPFNGSNNEEILMKVYNGAFDFRHRAFANVSALAKDLISKLLIKEPNHRLTAAQAFEHSWVKALAPLPEIPLDQEVYQGMSDFLTSQKLKRVTLMYIASKMNHKDIEHLKETFVSMDQNGDGFLSKAEFEQGMIIGNIQIDAEQMANL